MIWSDFAIWIGFAIAFVLAIIGHIERSISAKSIQDLNDSILRLQNKVDQLQAWNNELRSKVEKAREVLE